MASAFTMLTHARVSFYSSSIFRQTRRTSLVMCPRLLRRKKTNKETTNQPNKQTNKIGNCGEEQKHTQEEEEGKKRTQESWRQESWLWCLKYTVPWRQSRTSQSNRPKGACLCVSSYLYVSHLHRAERVKVTVLKVHVYVCHVIYWCVVDKRYIEEEIQTHTYRSK